MRASNAFLRLAMGLVAAVALVGCSGGPSADEVAAWSQFASYREQQNSEMVLTGPQSIKDYVLGVPNAGAYGYQGPDSILTGKFTGARTVAIGEAGASIVLADFSVHKPVVGPDAETVTINLGDAPPGVDVDMAVRGAGNVVVFLVSAAGSWELADGLFAIAQSDGDGRLSMPLVAPSAEGAYLSGLTDVADIAALAIAGNYDDGGALNGGVGDIGNDGVSDTENNLIDRANDLAG